MCLHEFLNKNYLLLIYMKYEYCSQVKSLFNGMLEAIRKHIRKRHGFEDLSLWLSTILRLLHTLKQVCVFYYLLLLLIDLNCQAII